MDRTQLFEHKPKESSNGEPLGAGLQTIYTKVHKGCMRLSIGLCTVHDIIVELGARLYDIRGGSVHSMRHRCQVWVFSRSKSRRIPDQGDEDGRAEVGLGQE